jgi:hypothetical protein
VQNIIFSLFYTLLSFTVYHFALLKNLMVSDAFVSLSHGARRIGSAARFVVPDVFVLRPLHFHVVSFPEDGGM